MEFVIRGTIIKTSINNINVVIELFANDPLEMLLSLSDHLHAPSSNERVFFDVGANIGTTGLLAVQHYNFDRAVFFEPHQLLYQFLQANVESVLSKIDSRMVRLQTENVAVGSAAARGIDFFPDSTDLANSTCVRGNPGTHGCRISGVISIVLDEYCALEGIFPSHLWIDVQGFELEVLLGAVDLLRDVRPFVLIEWWPAGMAKSGVEEKLISFLSCHFISFRALDHRFNFVGRVKDLSNLSRFLTSHLGSNSHTNIVLLSYPLQGKV